MQLSLELAAYFLFEQDPGRAVPISADTADAVHQAMAILAEDICAPPRLDELAKQVGASPFHFSRLFSNHAGMTIPKFVRKVVATLHRDFALRCL